MELLLKISLFIFFIFLSLSTKGQSHFKPNAEISFGVNYSNPYGEIKLVRGTRKVVTTDFTGSLSYQLKATKIMNSKNCVSISIGFANYTYNNREDYNDGYRNYSSDDFNYIPLFLHYDRIIKMWNTKLDFILGGHTGIIIYQKEINLLSELHLLEIPVDEWPPHPENLSPFDLEIHNGFGIGFHIGLRKMLYKERLFCEVVASASYASFSAGIINDFENDGDDDIQLKTNPFDLGIQIGYRF
jgi:hypothetical protein